MEGKENEDICFSDGHPSKTIHFTVPSGQLQVTQIIASLLPNRQLLNISPQLLTGIEKEQLSEKRFNYATHALLTCYAFRDLSDIFDEEIRKDFTIHSNESSSSSSQIVS